MASHAENTRRDPFHVAGFLVDPGANSIAGPDGVTKRVEPKVMDVIRTLAAKPGTVISRTALIETVWNVEFGGDESLTRAISKLRKILGNDAIETVPKRGYRLNADVGHAVQTADTLTGDTPASRPSAKISRLFGTPVAIAVSLVLAIGVGLFAISNYSEPSDSASHNAPLTHQIIFENIPECENDQSPTPSCSLTRTLAQAVMNARVNAVITTSPIDIDDQRSAGPLSFGIDTTQDHADDQSAVTLKIVNNRSGAVIWSKSIIHNIDTADINYRRDAHAIANGLHCVFQREITAEIRDDDRALALLFDACISNYYLDEDQMRRSARLLAEAAPNSSMAHALLALAIAETINPNTSGRSLSSDHIAQQRLLVRASADQAFALDPNNSEANLAIALSYMPGGHWATRARYFQAAIESDPDNALALALYAHFLREIGRLEEAANVYRSAAAANSGLHFVQKNLALLTATDGRPREAGVILDRLEKFAPDTAKFGRFYIAHWYGDPDTALTFIDRITGGYGLPFEDGQIDCTRKFLAARKAKSAASIDLATQACREDNKIFVEARYAAALGRTDQAFAGIEAELRGAESIDGYRDTILLFYPEMRSVRDDQRFMPLVAKLGLVEYWIESGKLPDFCNDVDLAYDCRREFPMESDHQQL